MTYVTIMTESDTRVHLVREPTPRAWAIFVALVACGFGAAFYSSDYFVWKMAYIGGAVFIGVSIMDDWEECILDKKSNTVVFKKRTLVQTVFNTTYGERKDVAILSEIVGVKVQEEPVKSGVTAYRIGLQFLAGYTLWVTETATIEDRSIHEAIANLICKFLCIDPAAAVPVKVMSEHGSTGNLSRSSSTDTTSDEGFDRIDKEELRQMDDEKPLIDDKSAQ